MMADQKTVHGLIPDAWISVYDPASADSSDPFIMQQRNIRTVIRVGERLYPDNEAEQHGITCVSCEFDEATPSPGVVTAFLYTLRTSKAGGVAVLSDGSGRAAVLCALDLMHAYGFSAAEATTWLRIMYPSMQMNRRQEDFLHAVGSMAGAVGSGGREEAFRRGVFRAWAAEDVRSRGRRRRPESDYDAVSGDDGGAEITKAAQDGCDKAAVRTAQALSLAMALECIVALNPTSRPLRSIERLPAKVQAPDGPAAAALPKQWRMT